MGGLGSGPLPTSRSSTEPLPPHPSRHGHSSSSSSSASSASSHAPPLLGATGTTGSMGSTTGTPGHPRGRKLISSRSRPTTRGEAWARKATLLVRNFEHCSVVERALWHFTHLYAPIPVPAAVSGARFTEIDGGDMCVACVIPQMRQQEAHHPIGAGTLTWREGEKESGRVEERMREG